MHAADSGYAPRFFGICLALSFFRFEGDSTLPPQAGNANRWRRPLRFGFADRRHRGGWTWKVKSIYFDIFVPEREVLQ